MSNIFFGEFEITDAKKIEEYPPITQRVVSSWERVPECKVELELVTGYANAISNYTDQFIKEYLESRNLINFGEGMVCQYCGNFQPNGKATCIRCTAPTTDSRLIESISQFSPDYVHVPNRHYIGLTYPGSPWDLPAPVNICVTFGFREPSTARNWYKLVTGNKFSHSSHIDEHLYLCQWCGMGVRHDKDCPGCAGTRLVHSDLIEISHVCIYCHKQRTKGSIWCNSCGARITGVTLEGFLNGDS